MSTPVSDPAWWTAGAAILTVIGGFFEAWRRRQKAERRAIWDKLDKEFKEAHARQDSRHEENRTSLEKIRERLVRVETTLKIQVGSH